ncbi:hypothetical protein Tco_0024432 [Tanacetum coccineum]
MSMVIVDWAKGFSAYWIKHLEEYLSFLPKEPSPGFGTGSPSTSVNIEPLRADEELVLQPAEVTADSVGSPKPELFVVHPGSVAA